MNHSSPLAEPLTLANGAVIPNRLAKAAMTEGLADPGGLASDRLERLYGEWSRGGAGLLITGNVQVDADHLERPGNVIIDTPPDEEAMRRLQAWAQAAKVGGNHLWMQISHGGRQTPRTVNPRPKAPSAIRLALPGAFFGKPVELTEDEIEYLIERFATAAAAAYEAGFDGAQVHAAHGYLISSFLSPIANQRTDPWGGTLENRARFLLEVVRRSRARVPAPFVVAVKLNSADFQRGGFGFADSLTVAGWLEEAGIDVLEISGGNYEQPQMMDLEGVEEIDVSELPTSTAQREAYFLHFATKMRERVQVPLMVTGGFRRRALMEEAITQDGVALIGLGRPLCVDPAAPQKLLEGAERLDRWEEQLQLGPGWFGPSSPLRFMKAVNAFAVISWFYQQLRRLGDGKAAEPKLGLLTSFLREQWTQANHLRATRKLKRA